MIMHPRSFRMQEDDYLFSLVGMCAYNRIFQQDATVENIFSKRADSYTRKQVFVECGTTVESFCILLPRKTFP